jgi:Domain of unknown function (DUF397)
MDDNLHGVPRADHLLIGSASLPHNGGWFKSRRSGGGSDCVQVRFLDGGGVEIRNSKRPEAGTLLFTDSEFDAFVGGAKDGDFDR